MNEHSSRSHALLCVEVTGLNKTTGAKTMGELLQHISLALGTDCLSVVLVIRAVGDTELALRANK